MTYADYLINKHNLYKDYQKRWSNGGTYGTCWDEAGPTACSVETPTDCYNFSEYEQVLKLFYTKLDTHILEKYQDCLVETEESEYDYYGGCQELGTIEFITRNLIDKILGDLYDTPKGITLDEAKHKLPELFL